MPRPSLLNFKFAGVKILDKKWKPVNITLKYSSVPIFFLYEEIKGPNCIYSNLGPVHPIISNWSYISSLNQDLSLTRYGNSCFVFNEMAQLCPLFQIVTEVLIHWISLFQIPAEVFDLISIITKLYLLFWTFFSCVHKVYNLLSSHEIFK